MVVPAADASRLAAALAQLHQHARPGELAGVARFGLTGERRLGVAVPTRLRRTP